MLIRLVSGPAADLGLLRIASASCLEVVIRLVDGIRRQLWAWSLPPGQILTREPAFSGMALDEIPSDSRETMTASVALVMVELAAQWRYCTLQSSDRRVDNESPSTRKAEWICTLTCRPNSRWLAGEEKWH
ncbi:hypothetical protein [Nocardia sp. SC052]|uniref:hypothetical protein n=1 Tax=Nocardia sichangensis TaxID=3385975 RepID=UPI0039A0193D